MMDIRLETDGGALVGTFSIPQFNLPPKVVTWGNRIFAFRRWDHRERVPTQGVIYSEVFAYCITSQMVRELTEKDLVEATTTISQDDGA